ncbi:MAG: Smr/MutS family protein [Alphaproteobacteria bacterium]|jgi:DNA-nicking Smr family endonuclease|nr:Smr/MutS family protein [Alphaproteobacteria bacterium]
MTDAWDAFRRTVRKLGDPAPKQPKTPKLPPATGTPTLARKASSIFHSPSSIFPVISNTPQRLAGCHPSVPSKTFKQLGLGQLSPQAVIDLHGLREAQAWLELHAFLAAMHGAEAGNTPIRVVLVIHGKGHGHGAAKDMGVIKSQLAAQLAQSPHVLAFHTAQPHDGGMGATYVLLKQK